MRSYQGPAPTRSIAWTVPVVALRNARHPLAPEPGIDISAIVVQILSAPRRPAPSPVSPNLRSPPKPFWLPDSRAHRAEAGDEEAEVADRAASAAAAASCCPRRAAGASAPRGAGAAGGTAGPRGSGLARVGVAGGSEQAASPTSEQTTVRRETDIGASGLAITSRLGKS